MNKSITPADVAKKAVDILKKNADPKKAEQTLYYFKEKISVYGLSSAKAREISKELYQEIKPYWTVIDALKLCEIMLPDRYIEAKGISILLLQKFVRSLHKEHLKLIKEWIGRDYCDNWAEWFRKEHFV